VGYGWGNKDLKPNPLFGYWVKVWVKSGAHVLYTVVKKTKDTSSTCSSFAFGQLAELIHSQAQLQPLALREGAAAAAGRLSVARAAGAPVRGRLQLR
jgi:hypothetical protein